MKAHVDAANIKQRVVVSDELDHAGDLDLGERTSLHLAVRAPGPRQFFELREEGSRLGVRHHERAHGRHPVRQPGRDERPRFVHVDLHRKSVATVTSAGAELWKSRAFLPLHFSVREVAVL